jgi:type IV secretory pathway VirB10-like protein
MNKDIRAQLVAAALMAFASLAQAQYMWIDEKGVKQFSDKAPPSSVPLKNILKAPRGVETAVLVPTDAPAAATAPAAAKPKAAPTVADRNADYNKRQKEQAALEKKEKTEREAKAAQAEHCDSLRANKRALDSGVRIGVQDKTGERAYMTEQQRAAEAGKVDKALASCK